ncbi:metal-dependent transcriptional regulator [bacterium]|nr:metal-dependent transcriptional regulator [bacterium]
MITQNREDYFRAIFCLNEQGAETVKSIDIVRFLKISKPAVSEMLKKLKKQGYIEMIPYSKISLTYKGFQAAQKITYKHRVMEVFLKEILDLKGSKLREEAHKLEHSMSDEVAKRMANFLKDPKFCPCGYKIPNIM